MSPRLSPVGFPQECHVLKIQIIIGLMNKACIQKQSVRIGECATTLKTQFDIVRCE